VHIAVLGTGLVGKTLAGRLAELGHEVTIGTRDPQSTLGITEPDRFGSPPMRQWLDEHPGVLLATQAEAAAAGELVINATSGDGSLSALRSAGSDNLAGKVLIDIANPLDFSQGMPPSLSVANTDSLAEQIQRAFPTARVVKTLNTTNARVMVNPAQVAGGDHTMFICGNDGDAKEKVRTLLESFGWTDIIDLGDITAARGAEMLLPIWVRLMGVLGTPAFNFKVAR
jgi:predicted dinucleotide-binding enzyme